MEHQRHLGLMLTAAAGQHPRATIEEFLGRLAQRGIRIGITSEGDVTAMPATGLNEGDRNVLRERKAEVVAALSKATVVA